MKITLPQLEQQLTKNIAPIYIVSSDELLLVEEAAESIRAAALRAGFSERTFITADSGAEWSKSLYATMHSMSLFSAKQFVELNMHNAKFNASTTKALQEYAEKPPENTLLLIRTAKVDGKTEKSVWFQSLEKKSVFISIWPIPTQQLPAWLQQRAKKIGLTLSKDSAELIANQTEGNLLAAAQEIEKLYLTSLNPQSNSSLTAAKEEDDNARFTVFDLVDSVIAENHSRSLRILKNLAAEDTEPVLILWALTREFRTLADMLKQIKQGATIASLFSKFRIFEKRQPSVRAFLQRHTQEQCWALLLKAARIDRVIKGADKGNVWDEMEVLLTLRV